MQVDEIWREAVRRHQAGSLEEAERLYREILATQPDHADCHRLLGVIALQRGRLDLAGESIGKALALRPGFAEAHSNLGTVLKRQGRLDAAIDCFRRAVAARPDFAEAHGNLGNALSEQGRLEEALSACRRAIELDPRLPQPHANLGNILMAQGRLDEAIASYGDALGCNPDFAEVLGNLGNAYSLQGRLDLAIGSYRRALAVRPDYPEALVDLGTALRAQGRPEEAVVAFRLALDRRPAYPEALSNLGATLRELGRFDEAIVSCRKALEIRPDYPEAFSNLGNALMEKGEREEAVACYRKAVSLKPDYPEALNNLAKGVQDQGRLEEAVACFRRALALRPDISEIHNNLGNALTDQGRLEEAIASYRTALALKPEFQQAYSNLIFALHYSERHFEELPRTLRSYAALMERATGARTPVPSNVEVSTSASSGAGTLTSAHEERGPPGPHLVGTRTSTSAHDQNHDADLEVRAPLEADLEVRGPLMSGLRPFANFPDPGRRLRIGYVSADLRAHPVGYFLMCALPAHDPSEVETFCYSNSAVVDDLTAGLRAAAHHWRTIAGRPDAEVDAMIRQDGIDILVDLAGHTARNRLAVFAARAAPVQATWLGYFGTTGLATMDYILADRFVVPTGEEVLFSETVWRLPDSYFCFAPPDFEVPILPRPAREAESELVLGSFNNWSKVSDGTVGLWSRVLSAIPDSRLLLKTKFLDNPEVRQQAFARFERHGIAPERLVLEGPSPRRELLAAYNRMDLALDPFPYGGGATTLEALWMGVPVVAQRGDRWVARVCESILATAGLPELVATDADDYVRLVERLARDRAYRDDLHRSLRPMLTRSPLCDGPRFASSLETAYRTMWGKWCARRGSRRSGG